MSPPAASCAGGARRRRVIRVADDEGCGGRDGARAKPCSAAWRFTIGAPQKALQPMEPGRGETGYDGLSNSVAKRFLGILLAYSMNSIYICCNKLIPVMKQDKKDIFTKLMEDKKAIIDSIRNGVSTEAIEKERNVKFVTPV